MQCKKCKHTIRVGGKYCQNCGLSISKLSKTSKETSISEKQMFWIKAPYFSWLVTLIVFLGLLVNHVEPINNFVIYVMFGGIVSFLFLIVGLYVNKKYKQSERYSLVTLLTLVSFFILMIISSGSIKGSSTNINSSSSINSTITKPTATPFKKKQIEPQAIQNSNQIDCTGPDGVVFKTTQIKCDEFNSAWDNDQKEKVVDKSKLIDCYVGGGIFRMTKEECEYSTQMIKEDNDRYQKEYLSTQEKLDAVYAKNETEKAARDLESAKSQYNLEVSMYNDCIANAKHAFDRKLDLCNSGSSYSKDDCVRKAEGEYIGDKQRCSY